MILLLFSNIIINSFVFCNCMGSCSQNYHFLNKENISFNDDLFPLELSGFLPVPGLRCLAFSL